MKKFLLFSILLSSISFSQGEWVLSHLQKRYEKNPEKCFREVKFLSKHWKNNPYVQFYLWKTSLDQLEGESNPKEAYNYFRMSLIAAQKFEKQIETDNLTRVDWESEGRRTMQIARLQINRWDSLGLEKYCSQSLSRLKKLKSTHYDVSASLNDIFFRPEKGIWDPLNPSVDRITGFPSGTERIAYIDLAEEKKLITILNAARKEKGLPMLEWNEELSYAARYHANDMAQENYFSHSSQDRYNKDFVFVASTFERIKQFYNSSFVNTENIAAGLPSAEGTYNQWFNSPGHYKNMFKENATKVGIGMAYNPKSDYKYYWVFCTAE